MLHRGNIINKEQAYEDYVERREMLPRMEIDKFLLKVERFIVCLLF